MGHHRRPGGRASASARDVERGLERGEIGRAEDDAITRGDVDEVEIDAGPGDRAGQIGEHAGTVLDLDRDHLALAADCEMRDRERVLGRLGVGDEDVDLGPLARSEAGGCGDVDAGVAHRGGDARESARARSRCR